MTKWIQVKYEAMTIELIKTKKDYQAAMNRLEFIFDSKPGTTAGDELEILTMLIEKYEDERVKIDYHDPVEAIKFRMEQMEYTQNDLAKFLGLKSRANELLSKKRKLTLDMIRKLHVSLSIPTDVLIQEY